MSDQEDIVQDIVQTSGADPVDDDRVDISPAQHLVWLGQSVAQGTPLYNLAVTYSFQGQLDVERFRRAVDVLVSASDILQSQVVDAETERPSLYRNVRLSGECRWFEFNSQDELSRWIDRACHTALDPTVKMFDCALLSLSDNQHVFYWCQHHMSSDGANIALIGRYLSEIYARLLDGQSDSDVVAAVGIPSYFQCLREQRRHATSDRHLSMLDYWQEKSTLDRDVPEYFGRPFDFSHAKYRCACRLTRHQRRAIDLVLERPEFRFVNRQTSLLLLMATLMYVTDIRLHGRTTLNFGFPTYARKSGQAKRSLGMFTAIGFLHLEQSLTDSFLTIVRAVKREILQSFAHIEPGMQTRQSQASYQAGINILSTPVVSFLGVPVTVDWQYPGSSDSNAQLDLVLTNFGTTSDFSLHFDFAQSVFTSVERQTYLAAFTTILDRLIENPGQAVCGFSLLTEEEQAEVLKLGTGERAVPARFSNLTEYFSWQVALQPDAVAVKAGERTLTFHELDRQSEQIAAYLHRRGVKAGEAVAVCFNRSIDMFASLLGVVKARAVFVPLDPSYPAERLAYMVANSRSVCVLTNSDVSMVFDVGDAAVIDVDEARPAIESAWQEHCDSGFDVDDSHTSPDSLYIMYTSGSTGLPKGVVGTHSATLNRFRWMWRAYPFQSGEICCQKTALSFVDSIWELFGPLLQGVPVVVVADDVVHDIFRFVEILESEQVSRLVVVPSFLAVILESDSNVGERLRSLELCVVSGEPLPLHVATAFLNRMSHCRLLNLYGSTEVTADVTADEVTRDKLAIRMPVGRPIDDVQILLLDDHQHLVPKGAVGEIAVAGKGLSAGYFDNQVLNAEKFVRHPLVDGRLFKTGDLGRFNHHGLLEHHGRRDAQIKIRGHRIESAEIENTLLDHEGVRSAVLFVGSNDQLYLFYVPDRDCEVAEEELDTLLKKRLPDFMVPQLVRLVQIPLLSNGKVSKSALAHLVPAHAASSEGNEDPRTPTEESLAAIWKQTLGIQSVNISADFFDIGGNSIAAMRIMVGARHAGFKLSLKQILELGNIAEIASAIDSNPRLHLIRSSDRVRRQPVSGDESPADEIHAIELLIADNPQLRSMDNVSDTFHLSASQKGILFHLLLQGEQDPVYLAQMRCDLIGELDLKLFQRAWNIVLERHDTLRSCILHDGLQYPVQVVAVKSRLNIEYHDLSTLDTSDQIQQRDALADSSLSKPIHVDSAPMLRVTLTRMSEDTAHLILDWHHIMMDGWSLAVVSNEVLLAYAALKNQERVELPPPGKFRDHVIALTGMNSEKIRIFWQEKLQGFSTVTPISQPPSGSGQFFARSNHNFKLDQGSSERLYEFARRCRVTPNTVIQAAWSLLLSRYNDTDDVLFGFAVTGRSSGISNYENTVGMFVNSLPMRLHVDSELTLVQWLRYVQSEQIELIQYENSSLVDVQKASELPPNAAMFDSLLVFQNVPRLTVSEAFPLEIANRTVHENSPTPITVEVFPSDRLEIQVMYIEQMFVDYPVAKLISHFTHIINSIASRPVTAQVSEIGIMGFEEIRQLTESFNQTERAYPESDYVSDLVWQQAALRPDALAISFGRESLSYGQLTARAEKLCQYLWTHDIRPNDLVAICLPRDCDLLVSILAVMRSGAAYLPLDPDYPQERIDTIIGDADVTLLLTSSAVAHGSGSTDTSGGSGRSAASGTSDARTGRDALRRINLDSAWLEIENTPQTSRVVKAGPEDLAYVIYTSGSTGRPKGVKVLRRNVSNFLYAMSETLSFSRNDYLLAVTTIAFDIAVLELFLPLIVGARVDLADRDLTFDGHAIAERIEEKGITIMQATPTTWRLLMAADWSGSDGFKALIGGEALPRDLCDALAPRVTEVWNMYGPTETTVWSVCGQVKSGDSTMSIGKPIANTEILILDGNDNLCPVTVPGELCIGGRGVSAGYLHRDDLTAEKFIDHPYRADEPGKVYRTGDLARWLDDGRLECLGRIDSQVKLRGFRIELGEIESVLADVPGIDHAVANLVKDDVSDYLAAYIVADANAGCEVPNELRLREILREKLPLYMTPAAFMILDRLPMTPNGKVDRKALPDPRSSDANLPQMATIDVYDLPDNQAANDIERRLSEIWEKVLRREKISVNSNFFDMGGNSISAMQLMAACRKVGLPVSVIDIFNLGTIRLLADSIGPTVIEATDLEPHGSAGGTADARSDAVAAPSHHVDDLKRIADMLKKFT